MRFNRHSDFEGSHSFLSASKYHWIRYDDDKLDATYRTHLAAQRGTDLHAFAAEAIRLGIKMGRSKQTLYQFVNDVLGFRMQSEQMLFYSPNSFGTADAISFKDSLLRIFDLKTGVSKASFDQLIIYAALFCLEYDVRPGSIQYDLRIYQNDEILRYEDFNDINEIADKVAHVMDKIVNFDNRINNIRMEVFA
mgnify:CR=1 FL=1